MRSQKLLNCVPATTEKEAIMASIGAHWFAATYSDVFVHKSARFLTTYKHIHLLFPGQKREVKIPTLFSSSCVQVSAACLIKTITFIFTHPKYRTFPKKLVYAMACHSTSAIQQSGVPFFFSKYHI